MSENVFVSEPQQPGERETLARREAEKFAQSNYPRPNPKHDAAAVGYVVGHADGWDAAMAHLAERGAGDVEAVRKIADELWAIAEYVKDPQHVDQNNIAAGLRRLSSMLHELPDQAAQIAALAPAERTDLDAKSSDGPSDEQMVLATRTVSAEEFEASVRTALDVTSPTWRATGNTPSVDDLLFMKAALAALGIGVRDA